MKHRKRQLFIYIVTIFFASSMHAKLDNHPYISSGSCGDVGEAVLAFAQKAYDSNFFNITEYAVVEEKEWLQPGSIEFSWVDNPDSEYLFVQTRTPFGWQGHWHALYWILANDVPKMRNEAAAILHESQATSYKPLESQLWQRIFFLRIKDRKDPVAIVPNHPAEPISEWTVYVPSKAGELSKCQIQFHPSTEACNTQERKERLKYIAAQFFPGDGSLCALITVLDEILGPGTNEGTLQQTSGIRSDVSKIIVNLALRPWVFNAQEKKPSSQEEKSVTKNIEKWASKNKSFKKQHLVLKGLYPRAEQELADYYEIQLGKTKVEAASLAQENLKILYLVNPEEKDFRSGMREVGPSLVRGRKQPM